MLTEALILFVCFIALVVFSSNHKRESKAAPGPWGLPFFGHLLFLGKYPHKVLLKWGKRYGPIMSVQFGSFPAVVINDGQLITKAFSSSKTAGRPFIKLFDEYSKRKGVIFADGPTYRVQRNFMMKHLKDFGAHGQSMEARILAETESLLSYIDSHAGVPQKMSHFYNRSVINSLLSILLSTKFETGDQVVAALAEMIAKLAVYDKKLLLKSSNPISALSLIANLLILTSSSRIDGMLENLGIFIPKIAEWFPNAVRHKYRIDSSGKIEAYIQALIEEHRKILVPGQPRDLTDAYLELIEATSDTEPSVHLNAENLVHNLIDAFVAGSDTTSNSLEWTTYYLSKHPEVLSKLQSEIDKIVGTERTPDLTFRPLMVYTEAVVNEVLRKSCVAPLGLLHRAVEDETIGGYLIPKNTTIVANIYAAHHDPQVWGDADNFRPERWIDRDGKLKKFDQLVAFSAGKRSCIGEPIARMQLWLFITAIFRRFDVKPAGKLPSPDGFGVTLAPFPFKAIFTRRNCL